VQFPWGTQNAVLEPGFHPRFFGEAIPFKKYLTVSFGGRSDDFSGAAPVQEIRFHDSVTANMRMTARFQLPENEEQFLPMAIAYRLSLPRQSDQLFPDTDHAGSHAELRTDVFRAGVHRR